MPTPSLNSVITDFLDTLHKNSSAKLLSANQQALDLFLDHLSSQNIGYHSPITNLRVGWAISYLTFLQNHRSIETEHLYSRAVLNFYAYADKTYNLQIDVTSLKDYYTEHRRTKDHTIPLPPIEEMNTIIDFVQHISPVPSTDIDESQIDRSYLRELRDKAFFLLLTDTGLKLSELCELRRYQLNFSDNILTIDMINLPLSSSTVSSITKYLQIRSPLDHSQPNRSPSSLPLFARHDKRASDNILPVSRWTGANIIEKLVSDALDTSTLMKLNENNQTITSQTFRHYFVITLLIETEDLEQTQHLARHTDQTTTRRYLKLLSVDIDLSPTEDS